MRNLYLLFFLISTFSLFGQSFEGNKSKALEAGFLFGMTNYSGDLAEKNIQISETKLGYGAYVRYLFSKHFALRAHLISGSISGDDKHAKDPDILRRQFRFNTNLLEVGLCGEWHILGRKGENSIGEKQRYFSPYVYLGLGMAFSDANATHYGPPEDEVIFFKTPLPEVAEPQRFLLAPMGVGVQTELTDRVLLGLETGWRPVFSDKLDGVSINGNPDKNDWYYYAGATVSFILFKPKKDI
jgi:hypothetical protein